MDLYRKLLRPLAFRMDPEKVHEIALALVARGLFEVKPVDDARLRVQTLRQSFPNPLGLAAGFDKDGVAAEVWDRLGFGHAELGTVTWLPQPGNPKPRLFRYPDEEAIVNRMGFNNAGARVVAANLASQDIPERIGINLGKSKATALHRAAEDYAKSYAVLHPYGHYFVVNVSSPNTPGLRTLQDPKPLTDIVQAVREAGPEKPLLVKVAPDLAEPDLDAIVQVAFDQKLYGLVATNTTLSREGLAKDPNQEGGLSGRPLKERSDQVLAHLARATQGKIALIGVGGVFSADDVWDKIALGADLVQTYTGWVYGGPNTVPNLLKGLLARMDREGVRDVDALRRSRL